MAVRRRGNAALHASPRTALSPLRMARRRRTALPRTTGSAAIKHAARFSARRVALAAAAAIATASRMTPGMP